MEYDKENAFPAMCSTPLVGKRMKSRKSFCRTPLTPVNSNIFIKRTNPAEVEVLKEYIKELHITYKDQFKEQRIKYEARLSQSSPKASSEHTRSEAESSEKEIQCELTSVDPNCSLSESDVAGLQRQLMKSNVERDQVRNENERQQLVIIEISQERDRLFQENTKLTNDVNELKAEQDSPPKSHSQLLDVAESDHQTKLMTIQQNYQILSNSHQELEMQLCHISTELDKKNDRVSSLFAEVKCAEEKLRVSERRCSDYDEKVVALEKKCATYEKQFCDHQSEAKQLGKQIEDLRQEFYSTKLEKSKIRGEMEFLLDERETRDMTLDELYKQLTETRKELERLQQSEECLQAKCEEIVVVCDEAVRNNEINQEMLTDAGEMSKYLCSEVKRDLPSLCNTNGVTYDECEITDNCPTIIGELLFLDHAIKLLKDVAGGVTINRNARNTIHQLKEDKAKLEETCKQLKYFTSEQKERLTQSRQYLYKVRQEKMCLEETLATDATLLEEYGDKCRMEHERNVDLSDKCERYSLKVSKQEEQLAKVTEQLELYDAILNTVKRKMLALGSSLPSSLRIVLNQLV